MGENFTSWANMSHTSYAPIINTGIQPQMCMFKSDESTINIETTDLGPETVTQVPDIGSDAKNTKIEFYYTTEMQHDIKYYTFLRKN